MVLHVHPWWTCLGVLLAACRQRVLPMSKAPDYTCTCFATLHVARKPTAAGSEFPLVRHPADTKPMSHSSLGSLPMFPITVAYSSRPHSDATLCTVSHRGCVKLTSHLVTFVGETAVDDAVLRYSCCFYLSPLLKVAPLRVTRTQKQYSTIQYSTIQYLMNSNLFTYL